jgi:hypothetical protein
MVDALRTISEEPGICDRFLALQSDGHHHRLKGALLRDSELFFAQGGDLPMNVAPRRPYRLAPLADHGIPLRAGCRGDHVADPDDAAIRRRAKTGPTFPMSGQTRVRQLNLTTRSSFRDAEVKS